MQGGMQQTTVPQTPKRGQPGYAPGPAGLFTQGRDPSSKPRKEFIARGVAAAGAEPFGDVPEPIHGALRCNVMRVVAPCDVPQRVCNDAA